MDFGYLNRFDEKVKNQFIQAGIFYPHRILTLDEIQDWKEILDSQDKEFFEKILKFDSKNTEDSAEFALAWLLDAKPIGKSQTKSDLVLPDGQGVSVKSGENFLIKFGRIGSSESYKELMLLWAFYVGFLGGKEHGLSPTRITKRQVENLDLPITESLLKFFDISLRSIPIFYSQKEGINIKQVIERMTVYSQLTKDKAINLINKSIKESLKNNVNHILVVDKNTLSVKLIRDIDAYEYDFFHTNFNHIAGNEVFIEVK